MLTLNDLYKGTKKLRGSLTKTSIKAKNFKKKYNRIKERLLFSAEYAGDTEPGIHRPQIVFEGISFSKKKDTKHPIPFKGASGYIYLAKPTIRTRVRVRCNCSDYRFTWYFWNKNKDGHWGKDFPPYERKTEDRPERNPYHVPGIDKHIISLIGLLKGKNYL